MSPGCFDCHPSRSRASLLEAGRGTESLNGVSIRLADSLEVREVVNKAGVNCLQTIVCRRKGPRISAGAVVLMLVDSGGARIHYIMPS